MPQRPKSLKKKKIENGLIRGAGWKLQFEANWSIKEENNGKRCAGQSGNYHKAESGQVERNCRRNVSVNHENDCEAFGAWILEIGKLHKKGWA